MKRYRNLTDYVEIQYPSRLSQVDYPSQLKLIVGSFIYIFILLFQPTIGFFALRSNPRYHSRLFSSSLVAFSGMCNNNFVCEIKKPLLCFY